jgi:aspartyl-tRNA(Asn)/glutamyl-tRNA(Gln) amidotransferase subunit A
MGTLNYMTAAEIGRLYRAGKLSPVELTKSYLDWIETYDHALVSYILVTRERALADARRAESELMRGLDRGPMHGIPYCQKDIVETAGIRTTGQSRSLAEHVPVADAAVEAKLRAGGGVLLGKTTTWEFAHGGPSWDVIAPPAHNPWNTDNHPAGSSSGTGAAIAAGLAAVGIGTDTGGSIRLPAAVCGIAGLKPTYGRVSRRGVLPNCFSHDHVGPLAWTSEDAALMLQAIAGHDPLDPGSAEVAVPDYAAALTGAVDGLRIGIPHAWIDDEYRMADATRDAFYAAVDVFRDLGATIVPVTLPPLQTYSDSKKTIAIVELFSIHEKTLRTTPHLLGESLRYRIQCGALIRAEDYVQAMRMRTALTAATQRVFQDVDLILTPTAEPAGKLEPTPHEWLFTAKSMTTPFNSTGHPALSICNGFAADGMPFSLQIAGRLFDEATVLRAGDAYEKATPWRDRRPVVPARVSDISTDADR